MHFRRTHLILMLTITLLLSFSTFSQSNYLTDSDKKVNQQKPVKKAKKITKGKADNQAATDMLLRDAKIAVLKEKNYPKAKKLLFSALKKNPKDPNVQIFLGRVYGWTDQYDSAIYYFKKVLIVNPKNENASIIYADLEYLLNHYQLAQEILDNAMKYHPKSQELIRKKIRINDALTQLANKSKAEQLKSDSINTANTKPQIAASNNIKPDTIINNPKANIGSNHTEEEPLSSDSLIILAREAAFQDRNYDKAKGYLYRAYRQNSTYTDIQIFLGRIYTWTSKYDSAKYFFESALKLKPDYEDLSNAYADLEYFNDHYKQALNIVQNELVFHQQSPDLLLRKSKILLAMNDNKNAQITVNQILKSNPKDSLALKMRENIKFAYATNTIFIGYDYSYFNKQFSDPWQMLSAEYGRKTNIGRVIARVNYASRFASNASQFEVDAYPRFSKLFNSYASFGVPLDNKAGIFPKFRAGFSLYANLPHAFAAELGIRYLHFSGTPTYIYTESLGKYYKNWLFTERVYVVPSNTSNTYSASFGLVAAYYVGGIGDEVVTASIGYGSSPDDRAQGILAISSLKSYRSSLSYKKPIGKLNSFSISSGLTGSEYTPGIHGYEFSFGIGLSHKF